MCSMVAGTYRMRARRSTKSYLSPAERTRYLRQHYLWDALRREWSGTGDTKAVRAVMSDRYGSGVAKSMLFDTARAWYGEHVADASTSAKWLDSSGVALLRAYLFACDLGNSVGSQPLSLVAAHPSASIVFGTAGIVSNVRFVDAAGLVVADPGTALPALPSSPTAEQVRTHLRQRFNVMLDKTALAYEFSTVAWSIFARDRRCGCAARVRSSRASCRRPSTRRQRVWTCASSPGNGRVPNFRSSSRSTGSSRKPSSLERITPYVRWARFHDAYRFELAPPPGALLALPQARIRIEAFQRVPAQCALALPRPRLLVADDVGLGKTVEAGLVYLELAARRRAGRVLVVAPASICRQWRTELLDKFGIEFDVFTRDRIEEVRRASDLGGNPFTLRPRVIVSLDLAKMDAPFAELRASTWDLAIVDEAHHVALGEDAEPTRNRRFAEWLAKATRGLLLLSATPHDGSDATFASLLRLLEQRIVPPGAALQRAVINPYIVSVRPSNATHLKIHARM